MREVLGILLYVALPALLLFAIQFISLRIRDTRASPQDPHLGRKALLYLFFNLAITTVMFGLTISSLEVCKYALSGVPPAPAFIPPPPLPPAAFGDPAPLPPGQVQPPAFALTPAPVVMAPAKPPFDWFSREQRSAAALVITGVFYAVIFFGVIRLFTNDREFPAVRRSFAAGRLAMAVLILMACSAISMVVVFQEGPIDMDVISQTMAFSIVWGPFAVIHFVLVLRNSGWRAEPRGG